MNRTVLTLQVLVREALVAVVTGLLTFGAAVLLAPGATGAAAAFALVAATAASALDTLYFHLLFILRRAPIHAAEGRYRRALADIRARLMDGSVRMREALIRRFEGDYLRTAATPRPEGRSQRQLREARRRLKARLWVIEHALGAGQLLAATTQAKTDPGALEQWSDRVDGMVDAYWQVRGRQPFGAGILNRLHPARLAAQVQAEWQGLVETTAGGLNALPTPTSDGAVRRAAGRVL